MAKRHSIKGKTLTPCERRTDVDAGDAVPREQALSVEYGHLATTLMRAEPRSLRPVYPDFVCANGRDGRVLGARNTSGGVYPGRGVEE